MRRIIERVVTVVTTTTWKISWEADPSHAGPATGPVSSGVPSLEVFPEIAAGTLHVPAVISVKEVHPTEIVQTLNTSAEEPPQES